MRPVLLPGPQSAVMFLSTSPVWSRGLSQDERPIIDSTTMTDFEIRPVTRTDVTTLLGLILEKTIGRR